MCSSLGPTHHPLPFLVENDYRAQNGTLLDLVLGGLGEPCGSNGFSRDIGTDTKFQDVLAIHNLQYLMFFDFGGLEDFSKKLNNWRLFFNPRASLHSLSFSFSSSYSLWVLPFCLILFWTLSNHSKPSQSCGYDVFQLVDEELTSTAMFIAIEEKAHGIINQLVCLGNSWLGLIWRDWVHKIDGNCSCT